MKNINFYVCKKIAKGVFLNMYAAVWETLNYDG